VTLAVSAAVFEILTLKSTNKIADFPYHSLFDVPARGDQLEFMDETYPTKTRGMGLPYGENIHDPIFNRFW